MYSGKIRILKKSGTFARLLLIILWVSVLLVFTGSNVFEESGIVYAAGQVKPPPSGVPGDPDGDGVPEDADNCPYRSNKDQRDTDQDSVGDVCDNCPAVSNAKQIDSDADNVGDACDNAPHAWNPGQNDRDKDRVPDVTDNCPSRANPVEEYEKGASMVWAVDIKGKPVEMECAVYTGLVKSNGDPWQPDRDCDGIGDACDGNRLSSKPPTKKDPLEDDVDGDGIDDIQDNCPTVVNPDQKNSDCPGNQCDQVGDLCDMDDDGDGILDSCDASPLDASNPADASTDPDGDGYLAECDPDDDGDGILDMCDADNVAGVDSDADGITNDCDNCSLTPNPDQADADGNGVGDVCEPADRIVFELHDPALTAGATGNNYNHWLPEDGRKATVRAILYQAGVPAASQPSIDLQLLDSDTTRLPGKYTNHEPGAADYDLGADYTVVARDTTSNTITIQSNDYGGSTVIEARSGTLTARLKIPRDTDGDGLPDRFETDRSLNPGGELSPYSKNSDGLGGDDTVADLDRSTNNESLGDGLTAFEEYRGVIWEGGHHRLSPEKKTLFVAGEGFAGFPFQIGPAFSNCGLEVYGSTAANRKEANLDVLIVTSYPVGYSAGDMNRGHIRRVHVRTWDIPVLGESYFGYTDSNGDYHYGQPTRIFAASTRNLLANDHPYVDGATLTAGDLSNPAWGAPNRMLDPLILGSDEKVEDQNDNGVLEKKEDKNKDGNLNGDHVEVDMASWSNPDKLKPFDIDNDTHMELPQRRGNPADLEVNSQIAGEEYTIDEVARHVITHEIGHAVGMGVGDPAFVDSVGHCLHDTNCLMYHYSIDFNRDGYFCPYHQSMIRIDNK